MGIIEVTTTVASQEQAQSLARLLVEQGLAACVQITGPVCSIYRWQGEICEEQEFRCVMKSSQALARELMEAIAKQHPYDTPEILVVEVAECSASYAQWLHAQLKSV